MKKSNSSTLILGWNKMTGDKELLRFLSENITMGLEALETLSKCLEKTDNKIKSCVDKSLNEYIAFEKKCKIMLATEEIPAKKGNLFAILMTKMGSKSEFMRDNSDAKIADTLIQGYNMGIIDITKKLKKYKDDVSKEVEDLANEYRDMMERNNKEVKGFL